jgi:hydroxymethylbilane synthase
MKELIKIGTRESELAVWQANLVQDLLKDYGYTSTLVPIKSEGDTDQVTPLYEIGVQGIFTRSLDIALLNNNIDIAVHSMKDVPTSLPAGIVQAAVLKRGNYRDIFIFNDKNAGLPGMQSLKDSLVTKEDIQLDPVIHSTHTIATSSLRRKAQWLHRYPDHSIVNLRGNVNTRLKKIAESTWEGAVLAAAGVERINLRPASAIELDWMLPAPSQGAIMIVCRSADSGLIDAVMKLNDKETEICTSIEKEFLRGLLGGCSTPISALAIMDKKEIWFRGNILSTDGRQKIEIEKYIARDNYKGAGLKLANELLSNGGQHKADTIRNEY